MNYLKSLFAICCFMAALVAGCGSSSSTTTGPANVNGVFADAPVVGMTYSCGSYNTVTGAGGSFTCSSGSTVTFAIGGITICKATVQAVMTPVSCAQATNASANASTPSVVAVAQFLLSINTTPATPPASPTTITITSAELTAATSQSLDFSAATQAQLLAAVVAATGNAGATLANAAYAQMELASTVVGTLVGNFSGTFMSTNPVGVSGTWTLAIAADGTVTGNAVTTMGGNGGGSITGSLTMGTTYAGTAGSSATWTGTLDTSKSPNVFSGTWTDGTTMGTFTGTKM
jgi:hypothetical protein